MVIAGTKSANATSGSARSFLPPIDPSVPSSTWHPLFNENHGVSPRAANEDHIVPLIRGGADTLENVRIEDRRCNALKQADTLDPADAGAVLATPSVEWALHIELGERVTRPLLRDLNLPRWCFSKGDGSRQAIAGRTDDGSEIHCLQ